MREAVEFVAEVVEEDGPYDILIGFSQVRQPDFLHVGTFPSVGITWLDIAI